jgi:hypothetical protein
MRAEIGAAILRRCFPVAIDSDPEPACGREPCLEIIKGAAFYRKMSAVTTGILTERWRRSNPVCLAARYAFARARLMSRFGIELDVSSWV